MIPKPYQTNHPESWPWSEESKIPALDNITPLPRISIVIPSYQQGGFLEEAIRSVLLQNYPHTELIIIDGGSSDETIDILKQYSPWLTHWESKPDLGQSHALNKGFSRAKGDLYGWLNSDDYYLPGAFWQVVKASNIRPNYDFFFGDEKILQANKVRTNHLHSVFRFQVMVGGLQPPSHASFWRASKHVPLNEKLHFIMDADLFKRMAHAGARPWHIPHALGCFRVHKDAKSSTIQDTGAAETQKWLSSAPRYFSWLWKLHLLLKPIQIRIK